MHPTKPIFDTMSDEEKVPYLKIDRGRYFYQRRVPQKMQAHLGIRRWQLPCGDVSYSKAVQMVVTWAEEHDELIAHLRNPEKLRQAGVAAVRQVKARRAAEPDPLDLPRFYEMTERLDGEKQFFPRHAIPRPWQAAAKMLRDAEVAYAGKPDQQITIETINFWIEETRRGDPPNRTKDVHQYPEIVKHIETLDPKLVHEAEIRLIDLPPPMAPELYLDWLVEAYEVGFGPDRDPPADPDQKDEYDFIKRKLECKISELSPDPHTLTANRPSWNVLEGEQCDLTKFDARPFRGVDLVAGGVPCPPFSKAGKQLGADDERDLFPHAVRVIDEVCPKALMLENVRGFLDAVFHDYRNELKMQLKKLGYCRAGQ